jgi:hypothetical protein
MEAARFNISNFEPLSPECQFAVDFPEFGAVTVTRNMDFSSLGAGIFREVRARVRTRAVVRKPLTKPSSSHVWMRSGLSPDVSSGDAICQTISESPGK